MASMRVAITGAGGFIGRHLCEIAAKRGHTVFAIAREGALSDRSESWKQRFADADAVIHLAALAHITDSRIASLEDYRRVNVEGTRSIAVAASEAGVRRIVYVSSVGVLGNSSGDGVFTERSTPAPADSYAVSKLEAERMLQDLGKRFGLEIVIVRPPLVYGPNVKGNFLRLLQLVATGLPLPFASIVNRRSFVGIKNLADLLLLSAASESAAGEIFLVSDDQFISTPELVQVLGSVSQRSNNVFRCPLSVLRGCMTVIGKRSEFMRLSSNLVVDSSHARSLLGWRPQSGLFEGLREMAQWYFSGKSS